jgi:hypothetical protein
MIVMALALVLSAPVTWAASLEGVTMADEVTVSGKTLQLNGMGLRKKLWVEVYVAGLYLETTGSNGAEIAASKQTKKVVMHFLTNKVTQSKMRGGWSEGFENNSPGNFNALKARLDTFNAYFGDMKVGDRVELVFEPGSGVSVSLNGTAKGTIEGDDFAEALMLVWLGDEPPSDDLKEGMLGLD